jgi:hypothetical protein
LLPVNKRDSAKAQCYKSWSDTNTEFLKHLFCTAITFSITHTHKFKVQQNEHLQTPCKSGYKRADNIKTDSEEMLTMDIENVRITERER